MRKLILAFLCLGLLIASATYAADSVIRETQRNGNIVVGKVDLPSAGIWRAKQPAEGAGIEQVYLVAPRDALRRMQGRRFEEMERRRKIRNGRRHLYTFSWKLQKYARDHEGVGPASLEDLSKEDRERLQPLLEQSPWPEDRRAGPVSMDRSTRGPMAEKEAEAAARAAARAEEKRLRAEEAKARAAAEAAARAAEVKAITEFAEKLKAEARLAKEKGDDETYAKAMKQAQAMEARAAKLEAEAKAMMEAEAARLAAVKAREQAATRVGAASEGPFYFIVPNVRIYDKVDKSPEFADATPMVLELRPYVDDGKHWVLFSTGRVERVEIDRKLLDKHNLKVNPLWPADAFTKQTPQTYTYTITALATAQPGKPVQISLFNMTNNAELTVAWDTADSVAGGPEVRAEWAKARALQWVSLSMQTDAPVLKTWLNLLDDVYGMSDYKGIRVPGDWRRDGRTTSVFNVLGGRAAVRETLQMQDISGDRGPATAERTIQVNEIAGVEVKSHPFDEMLAGKAGGSLPLADAVPVDRFFMHFAKPAEMLDMLDSGAEFLSRFGGIFTRNSISYDLSQRYLERLGVTETWARSFLQSGLITEMAVMSPDMFFIDGTDLTVIMRIPQLGLATPLLSQLGVRGLGAGKTVSVPTTVGTNAYWAARGDLLIIGTSEEELQKAATLIDKKGAGSLGRSAEFRYMLTQLPLQDSTAAYAYFSDPFIRRLVGPEVKIGQLRRMRTRADLEALAAGALLYKADGHTDTPAIADLIEAGYAPARFAGQDYALSDRLVPSSETWGTPAIMKSLSANPVELITVEEQQAYQTYVRNYTRFWRRFFDPIAMRLDLTGENSAELTTFILPLLDSQMYDGLRKVIATRETGGPLNVPGFQPEPVAMVSVNIAEEAWTELFSDGLDDFMEFLNSYTPIGSEIMDHIGPSAHLAVMDADPILSLGSGDIMGIFSGPMAVMGDSEMFFIPLALATLTRPVKLLVEVDDPDAVAAILEQLPSAQFAALYDRDEDVNVEFYKATDRDAWVCSVAFAGIVKLRFGIEMLDRFLVISNLPWAHHVSEGTSVEQPLKGAGLRLNPGAIDRELAALYTTAQDNRRAAAVNGMAYLLPMMLAGASDPAQAADWHESIFGFKPVHPSGGTWEWTNGELVSDTYGSAFHANQPEYQAGMRDFGLMRNIEELLVNAQIEETGLRTLLRWTWRSKEE